MTPRAPVTGLNMPYTQVGLADGQVHRIGTAQHEILRQMLSVPPDQDGVRRMAQSDLARRLPMGQRGEATMGTRRRAVDRAVEAGRLRRVGGRTATTETGRKAQPVELTEVGMQVAQVLGLMGRNGR